jgi:type I restriction enzyme R subunit
LIRDAVRTAIEDFLWSDATGLSVEFYTEEEVKERSEEIFRHVSRAYPTIPSPFYEKTVAA